MNHAFYFSIFLLFSGTVIGAPKPIVEKVSGDRTERSYDINNDGKADYVEVTIQKALREKKEDLDFDGSFDLLTTFPAPGSSEFSKIVEQKANSKGPRKRITYWDDLRKKLTFSHTQIDENNDGIWDKEYKSYSDLNQYKEDKECDQLPDFDAPLELGKKGIEVLKLVDDYFITDWGHKIHKSCLELGQPDWFIKNSERAIKEGLACLENLGKEGASGAVKNNIALSNLLKDKKVQVICNETNYDWSNAVAHATTGDVTDPQSMLTHPGISVGPSSVQEYEAAGKNGQNEFVKTIFHEQLHNLGFRHGHDVEYPYACETCCFPGEKDKKELTAASCKVCGGDYTGATDINYIRDISTFGALNFDRTNGRKTTVKFLKEKQGDLDGMSYLAFNLSGVFDPIGGHLAEKLEGEKGLSEEQKKVLKESKAYKDSKLLKKYDKSSKILADAYYLSYKGDPGAALKILEKEMKTIKEQLALSDPDPSAKYVKANLKQAVEDLVYDVWLNDYSGKAKGTKEKEELHNLAYKLYQDYGL